jgi:hypothetical protein
MKVRDLEQVLLAVGWVSDVEQCLFQLFPEVTFWDTAQKKNSEKQPLFLVCGKDGKNSSFTYLPAFMPSESMWVFTWLCGKAMPALIGSSFLKETLLLLTDGDRNEYQPSEVQIVTGTFVSSQYGLYAASIWWTIPWCPIHLASLAQKRKWHSRPLRHI